MLAHGNLAARPAAFASLGGLTLADFEALYHDFAAAYAKDRQQSLTRAGGRGTLFTHDGRTRLLMALVFLRLYHTYEALSFFFSPHKANAQRGVVEALLGGCTGNAGSPHRLRVRAPRSGAAEAALGAGGHGRLPGCAPGHRRQRTARLAPWRRG